MGPLEGASLTHGLSDIKFQLHTKEYSIVYISC
jgi:hypothetical protein